MAKKLAKRDGSVMFLDIVRFLEGTRSMSDEGLAEFLQAFYKDMGDIVVKYGGRIVKYMGDSFLVVFDSGAEDGAVQCALDLQEGFTDLCQGRGLSLGLEIGVHTGDLICGTFGHSSCETFDVAGRDVMLAAIVCGCGEGVNISEATHQKLQKITDAYSTTQGQVEVSWKGQPVKVFSIDRRPQTGPVKPIKRF